jgi:hypothetical protein
MSEIQDQAQLQFANLISRCIYALSSIGLLIAIALVAFCVQGLRASSLEWPNVATIAILAALLFGILRAIVEVLNFTVN